DVEVFVAVLVVRGLDVPAIVKSESVCVAQLIVAGVDALEVRGFAFCFDVVGMQLEDRAGFFDKAVAVYGGGFFRPNKSLQSPCRRKVGWGGTNSRGSCIHLAVFMDSYVTPSTGITTNSKHHTIGR